MIPLYTREEMRATDLAATEQLGLPSLVLMESAGALATAHLLRRYAGRLGRVVVFGGEGQNGGDGWVVARHLSALGHRPTCILVGDPARIRGDAALNYGALRALGLPIERYDGRPETLAGTLETATLLVDGLYGTGLARPIEGATARLIEALCAAKAPICALDLPSGIDANTGQVRGVAIRATSTVTFAGHKRGLHVYPGAAHAGEVECVSIGVAAHGERRAGLIEDSDVRAHLLEDARDAHKGTRGHILALAGSPGKTGAALLSGLGALRAGAGLVTIACDPEAQRSLEQKVVELMTTALDPDRAYDSACELAAGKRAALLGPGFGTTPSRLELARALARDLPIPCVLDADGLTALSGSLESLRESRAARILTPHPAEAARLIGASTEGIQADRYAAALELAARSSQVVVLKGARTVIASPDGRLRVSRAGSPALGVAGTGDVLAGAAAALLARVAPFEAAWLAVELHATAGELAAVGDRGLLASEVAHALPRALARLRGQLSSVSA